jgi:twitching motility protein PilT
MSEIQPGSLIDEWLRAVAAEEASDLHVGARRRPMMRVSGTLVPIAETILTTEESEEICLSIVPPHKLVEAKELGSTDFSFDHDSDRYRANVFKQRNSWALVCRRLPADRLSFDQIGAPPVMKAMAYLPRGLVLVTGPTGSGKTTTLASMIHEINEKRSEHIITLEDPIEFEHESLKSVVNQREIGEHSESFPRALRAALREDPDVIIVGEMRNLETIQLAITAAETGHLVLGTLHTGNAPRTLDRILDVFPIDQRGQIRVMVAESLRGIISQQLVPAADGNGRCLALEVLVNNPAVAATIRDGKTFMLPGIMQTGKSIGMTTMDDSLRELYISGQVTAEEVLHRCEDRTVMREFLQS